MNAFACKNSDNTMNLLAIVRPQQNPSRGREWRDEADRERTSATASLADANVPVVVGHFLSRMKVDDEDEDKVPLLPDDEESTGSKILAAQALRAIRVVSLCGLFMVTGPLLIVTNNYLLNKGKRERIIS